MRKLKELMRLKFEARLTHRQIGRSLGLSPGTKVREARLGWPLPEGLDEAELESRLFSAPAWRGHWGTKHVPDFPTLHQELKRKGVALQLLWEVNRAEFTGGSNS